jgi:hypothetical protein
MTRFEDPLDDDDGAIPGVSDGALSGRDLENPETDRLATDSLDDLREQELGAGRGGAYGDRTTVDPAMAAVIEAGGAAEGFEQSDEDLLEQATDAYGATRNILFDAIDDEEEDEDDDYDDDEDRATRARGRDEDDDEDAEDEDEDEEDEDDEDRDDDDASGWDSDY